MDARSSRALATLGFVLVSLGVLAFIDLAPYTQDGQRTMVESSVGLELPRWTKLLEFSLLFGAAPVGIALFFLSQVFRDNK